MIYIGQKKVSLVKNDKILTIFLQGNPSGIWVLKDLNLKKNIFTNLKVSL